MERNKRLNQALVALTVAAGLLFLGTALAIPNPELTRRLLEGRASEDVTIEVTGVRTEPGPAKGQVTVSASAVVRAVVRSKSELEAGDSILVVYVRNVDVAERAQAAWEEQLSRKVVGGVPPEGIPDLVRAGTTYRALLSAVSGDDVSGVVYRPASAGISFERVETSN